MITNLSNGAVLVSGLQKAGRDEDTGIETPIAYAWARISKTIKKGVLVMRDDELVHEGGEEKHVLVRVLGGTIEQAEGHALERWPDHAVDRAENGLIPAIIIEPPA